MKKCHRFLVLGLLDVSLSAAQMATATRHVHVLAIQHGDRTFQWERPSRPVFENEDFAIVRLSDLRDPKLETKTFSGLLVYRGRVGVIDSSANLWRVAGRQEGSEKYYWANSASANRLTSLDSENPSFLVVPKSGEEISTKIFSSGLPSAFIESVDDDILSIAVLVDRGEYAKSPSQREQVLARAGLEDLLFKSRWISSNVNSSNPFVNVIARTVDQSGTVVQHCTVWYVPNAWEDDRKHWKRFDQFSSPTSQSVAVGQYKMWANHNGKDGTKAPVNPGDDQRPTKNIDLDVP